MDFVLFIDQQQKVEVSFEFKKDLKGTVHLKIKMMLLKLIVIPHQNVYMF